jgi:hypothetical protein
MSARLPLVQESDVMDDVARRDVGKGAHREWIIARDAATVPRIGR